MPREYIVWGLIAGLGLGPMVAKSLFPRLRGYCFTKYMSEHYYVARSFLGLGIVIALRYWDVL